MRLIQCPEEYVPQRNETVVFLAGGITGCEDWQTTIIYYLKDTDNLTLLNPRRVNFDVTNPNMSSEQIEWEFRHLHIADAALFWFPSATLCPITLYELGSWSALTKPLFIGTDPKYGRRFDVMKQTTLRRPEVRVVDHLMDLAWEVARWVHNNE